MSDRCERQIEWNSVLPAFLLGMEIREDRPTAIILVEFELHLYGETKEGKADHCMEHAVEKTENHARSSAESRVGSDHATDDVESQHPDETTLKLAPTSDLCER